MCSKKKTTNSTEATSEKVTKLLELINEADAVVIGAGAGLSTSAGLNYGGERFQRLFSDYIERYQLTDMYSAAFYEHKTEEELWGYWCKHIYHNRYAAELDDTYKNLLELVSKKNFFVITTNGDHLFRLNNFPKDRLFYTQGDYGLFQCAKGCHNKTYDNHETIIEMIEKLDDLKIPTELIPHCPVCHGSMTVNLRKDSFFVEDDGWNQALARYEKFLKDNLQKKVLFLELGVGFNTPTIIKYPFMQMTYRNKNANYVCINLSNITCPKEIESQSLFISDNISEIIQACVAQKTLHSDSVI